MHIITHIFEAIEKLSIAEPIGERLASTNIKEFTEFITNNVVDIPLVITGETVVQTEQIMLYFVNQKMILSGYNLQDDIYPTKLNSSNYHGKNLSMGRKRTLEASILLNPKKVLFWKDFCHGRMIPNMQMFLNIIENLSSDGIGEIVENCYRKNQSIKGFKKFPVPSDKKKMLDIINVLAKYEVGGVEYFQTIDSKFDSE